MGHGRLRFARGGHMDANDDNAILEATQTNPTTRATARTHPGAVYLFSGTSL